MDKLKSLVSSDDLVTCTCLWGGVVVGVTLVGIYIYKLTRSRSYLTPDAPRNTVLLHQPDRGPYAPNLVPFAVKLETYLRMTKIPYKIIPSLKLSPKGKVPWIEYNGEILSDSSSSIQYLNKKLDIDLNKALSRHERGVAKAVQRLTEEHLFWFNESFPWVLESDKNMIAHMMKMGRVVRMMARRWMRNRTEVQGIGRHSPQEQTQLMEEDLQALSDILGTKKFFFGDKATEVDCSVFGQLAQFRWNIPDSTPERVLTENFPNLCEFCERMRTSYWPDWDECITHGKPWGSKK